MPNCYLTIENQLRPDGTWGVLYQHFDEAEEPNAKNLAFAKLYTILAAAAVSECPYHAGHLQVYTYDGMHVVAGQTFDRRELEEPEPVEE